MMGRVLLWPACGAVAWGTRQGASARRKAHQAAGLDAPTGSGRWQGGAVALADLGWEYLDAG
jgi:hypothetical protein